MAIYKFISRCRVVQALCDRQLRLTQPAYFNDPYESRYYAQPLGGSEALRDQVRGLSHQEIADRCIAMLERFPPLVRNAPRFDLDQLKKRVLEEAARGGDPFIFARGIVNMIAVEVNYSLSFEAGVLCFTGNRTNLLQWAHYAEQHQGLVLEFNESDPFFSYRLDGVPNERSLQLVDYDSPQQSLDLDCQDVTAPVYRKSKDWEYEDERRLLMPLSEGTEKPESANGGLPVVLKQYPPSALTGLVLGYRMTGPETDAITDFIASSTEFAGKVRVEHAIPQDRSFGLDIIPPPPERTPTRCDQKRMEMVFPLWSLKRHNSVASRR